MENIPKIFTNTSSILKIGGCGRNRTFPAIEDECSTGIPRTIRVCTSIGACNTNQTCVSVLRVPNNITILYRQKNLRFVLPFVGSISIPTYTGVSDSHGPPLRWGFQPKLSYLLTTLQNKKPQTSLRFAG